MSAESVQRAHDELLGILPEGSTHACQLCQPGTDTGQKEVAEVADGGRTFTETEHFALLADAVTRETAGLHSRTEELEATVSTLTAEKAAVENEKSELVSRIDVLEAEKVSVQRAHDTAVEEFEAFKRDLEEKAQIEERKSARVTAVKEVAGELLDDEYFTADRVQRWAEMADESFEQVIADMRDLAAKALPAFLKSKKDPKDKDAEKSSTSAPETAAFKGGTSPSADGKGSALGQFLNATGRGLPVSAN